MSGTSVRYPGYTYGEIEVLRDGRVISTMDVAKFCALDGDLRDVAERAMSNPGAQVAVPNYGRTPRPRHATVHGICQ
jgi:hypothetical protein